MMAKKQKVKRFSIQAYDAAHYRLTEQYTQVVEALFNRATDEVSRVAEKSKYSPDKPFAYADCPSVKSVMQNVVKQLASRMVAVIESGSRKQWLFSCDKNDAFIGSIMDTSKLTKARLNKMQDRNLDALSAFQKRKVDGLDLSQRVWKYVNQYRDQLEVALDVGLGEGRSADQLSRDVRQNLKDPDRLFRRVRDKRGNLGLSKAAKAFHPGQGVYRSSYKNAMRLTRSEINMAYRESDYNRWQQLDFVVGFEVHRSNHEPLCKCDLCARLVGQYPKTFRFVGWHPQCMCYAIPILMDKETFDANELGDLKAALRGTNYKKLQAKNLVTDMPKGFTDWVDSHIDKQRKWSSTPYFIRDNFKNGKLADGLKIALPVILSPAVKPDSLNVAKVQTMDMKQMVELAHSVGIEEVNFDNGSSAVLGSVPSGLNSREQREWNENAVAIENKLNIVQGKEMTFEEADGLRANENYIGEDKTPRPYLRNCQCCVVAYELRRRGYNVTAQPNYETVGSIPDTLSKNTDLAWLDKDGNAPRAQSAGGLSNKDGFRQVKSQEMMLAEFAEKTKSPGRYHVKMLWSKEIDGHIITVERFLNGGLRIYDPQNGRIIKDFKAYTSNISLAKGLSVLRVDNLRMNIKIINGIVNVSKKKK